MPPRMAPTDPTRRPLAEPARAHAFGLDVGADFEIPGLRAAPISAGLPHVRVRQVEPREIDRRFSARDRTRLSEERFSDNRPADRTVDHHPVAGYRLYARYFGLALVSHTGEEVLCAPPAAPSWRWQRFLVGRALPLAALLRGYELLHASAVAFGDRMVAIVGPSGSGKSTLALHLALRGALLLTDDVLALALCGECVHGYPGPGVISLRESEDELVSAAAGPDGPAKILGWSGKSHLASPPRPERCLPVDAVYFVRGDAAEPVIEELARPDPRLLLSSTLMHEIRSAERLRRQLDVCAALTRSARHFKLLRARDEPAATAEALARHVLQRLS